LTLARLLPETAARYPDRPALIHDRAVTTYSQLERSSAEAAGALRAHGVGPGDRVALVLPNRPQAVAAYHGVLRLGATVVPLNPLLTEREIELRVADSGAARFEVDDLVGGPQVEPTAAPPGDGVAVILYTSGTTGDPKRIELTQAGLRLVADYLAHVGLELHEDDVVYGVTPLAHVLGMSGCMNATFAAGACLALVSRFDAAEALDQLGRERIGILFGVPSMCTALLAASEETGLRPPVRIAHIGGAPAAVEVIHAFEERFGGVVLEGYGMTEAGGTVTLNHAGRERKPGSVGTPASGGVVRIADDGEVLIRSPTLMRGHDDWFATGDVGRLDEDGYLYLYDRKKDVILRAGYTVYPREVEEVLYAFPGVREAVVVGVPHESLGEEVVALVVAGPDGCDAEALKAFARERVAAYKYPRLVIVVDRLPHNASGKIQRREIDRDALAELL
jgi:long-chain acyl-CoA synthetase